MADPLDVQCPDCMAPPGQPCRTSLETTTGQTSHADRQRDTDLRAVEHGTCALCGHPMVQGSIDGAPTTAWHPDPTDAATCPPLPDPATRWNDYAATIRAGLSPGHPGAKHFIPLGSTPTAICPDCTSGKHINCTGEAWDHTADEPAPCTCQHAPRP